MFHIPCGLWGASKNCSEFKFCSEGILQGTYMESLLLCMCVSVVECVVCVFENVMAAAGWRGDFNCGD